MSLPLPSEAAIDALAATGTLRAAINVSNLLLVTGETADGDPEGVSPDMAGALADSLGVGIELLRYESPGAVADAADSGEWDIGNIGAEPVRAQTIAFTSAYAEIEATYLVPPGSSVTSVADVDQPGMRVVTKARSAYGLWLERNIQHAELILVEGPEGPFEAFVKDGLDALAGLRPGLMGSVERIPGARILEGRFTAVQQAMGTPRGRDQAGIDYLTLFVEAAKASGLVADLIERHAVEGLSVAPPN